MNINWNNASPHQSGIYRILNTLNGRCYYGSTVSFKARFSQHRRDLERNKHANKFLQADFNKCGAIAFMFEVLEVVEGKTKEERLGVEETYLAQYFDSGAQCYNLCSRAISREGFLSKSPEDTAQKCSITQKQLWQDPVEREKRIEGKDGKRRERTGKASKKMWATFTPEERQHMSEEQRRKAHEFWHTANSEEARAKAVERGKALGRRSYKAALEKNPNHHNSLSERASCVEYVFISPDGTVTRFANLLKFCNEHGFSYQVFYAIAAKGMGASHGWVFVEKSRKPSQKYKV